MATLVKTGIGDGKTLTPIVITELYDAFTGDKLFDNIIVNNVMKVTHDGKVSISSPNDTKPIDHELTVKGTIAGDIGRFTQIFADSASFTTSSISIHSGSNVFGASLLDNHFFSGSITISGSNTNVIHNPVAIGTDSAREQLEVGGSVYVSNHITASNISITTTGSFQNVRVIGDLIIDGNVKYGISNVPGGNPLAHKQFTLGTSGSSWNSGSIEFLQSNTISASNLIIKNDALNINTHTGYLSSSNTWIENLRVEQTASFGFMEFGPLTNFTSASIGSLTATNIKTIDPDGNEESGSENQLLMRDSDGKLNYDYADRTTIIGRNISGGTINANSPVIISSYVADDVYGINLANATTGKHPAVGLTLQSLEHNESGSITLSGLHRGAEINTSGFSVGNRVFLGENEITSSALQTPGAEIQIMGTILKSSATNGEVLLLSGGGGGSLDVLDMDRIFVGSGSITEDIHISGALDRTTINNITGTGTASFGRVEISGDSNFTGDVTIGGNINIGDADTDSLTISADLSSSLIPDADSTYDLGNSTKYWRNQYVDTITATGNISSSLISTASVAHQHVANNLGVGIESPLTSVHISASDGIIIPVGDTSQRSSSPIKGEIRFNTTQQTYEGYDGNNWGSLGGMNDVDQDTKITAEDSAGDDNDQLKFFTAGTERLRINADGHISASANITSSGNLKILGDISSSTLTVSATETSSTAITTNNITNGYPTSNNWGENLVGSFFDNFTHESHVSEILRFMAGVISHSIDTAAPTPNTKIWNTVSTSHTQGSTTSKSSLLNGVLGSSYENARLSNSWTGSAYIDLSETASYRSVQDYLELKGWVQSSDRGTNDNDVGTNPFHGSYASRIPSTIQTNGSFDTNNFTITANVGGTSAIFSNSNYFGLGELTNGGATAYTVRVLASQSFSDNYSDSTPDKNSTFHTSSFVDYTISNFGTSNGLILAKIDTSQPAVIPASFQDGDFNSVAGSLSGRFHHTGSVDQNTISASGYYQTQDIQVGLQSGSQSDFTYKDGSDSTNRFYLYTGDLPSDITDGAPTPSITKNLVRTSFSATSRSLSGAPYLLTTTYGFTYSARATNCFDPCYGYNSTPLINNNPTDTWDNIGSTSLSNTSVSVTNSGVQSTGASTYVISSDFSTKRTSNQIPHISDVTVASSSFSFSLDSNSSNVVSARSTQESLNYSLTFKTTARNWKNSSTTSTTSAESFYDASLFGQPSSSGSMAVYSRAQGYDTNTLTDSTETFTGEDFRIELEDKVQQFNGDYFTTDSYKTNDNGDAVLGNFDLQVKPGFLVDPGGTRGYWFPTNFGSGTYKYYIRRFQKNSSGTKTSMTLNLGTTLVAWNSTSDGVACAILFESSGKGSGNNSSLGTARIYDPTATTSNVIEQNISNDNHKNPFSTAIDLYGNTGGELSSTTYTIPIRNADGMFLDDSDNQLYIIVRYKGDPTPITSITLGYS